MDTATVVATRITADEIKERMDRGEQFVFLDDRNPKAWEESDVQLPGAIRVPADAIEDRLAQLPRDRTIVTYCT